MPSIELNTVSDTALPSAGYIATSDDSASAAGPKMRPIARVADAIAGGMTPSGRDDLIALIDDVDPWQKRSDMPSLIFKPGGVDDTAGLIAAIATVNSTTTKGTIVVPYGTQLRITDDVDFGLVSFDCNTWINLTPDKQLIWGGSSINAHPVFIRIETIWDGTSVAPTLTKPQVVISGLKHAHAWLYRGAWVELYADGSVTARNSTAYNTIQSNFKKLSIYGVSGGWVNQNKVAGRVINMTIGGDGSYVHNNNEIDGTFEGASISLDHAESNLIRGRFEASNTVSCSSTATNNHFIQTWSRNGRAADALLFNAAISDSGFGNKFSTIGWSLREKLLHARAVVASGTTAWTWVTDTDKTLIVYAGTLVRFSVKGTGFRPYVLLTNLDGTALDTLSNITGTNFNQSTADGVYFPADVGNNTYALAINVDCIARVRWRVGSAATGALAVCSIDVASP